MAGTDTFTRTRRPSIRFMVAPALCLAGLLGCALLAVAADIRATLVMGGPVYTVAEVRAYLLHEPAGSVNRTLRVRAIFGACQGWLGAVYTSPCVSWQTGLLDPGPSAQSQFLPLTRGTAPPLLAVLRRLPLLAPRTPAPQAPAFGRLGVYRVQLRPLGTSVCGTGACVQAVLVDAAPDALGAYPP